MKANLQVLYEDTIKKDLQEKFNFANAMQIPYLKKITINMGVGEAAGDSKILVAAENDLKLIAGQKPIRTHATKSEAGFKIRQGQAIGCKVTLRGKRMYEFLERLIYFALPRVRDFRGLNGKSFDKNGNYSFGLKEQIVFPEIDYDKIDTIRGMDINIITSTSSNEEAKELLKAFNIPFYN